MTADFSLDKKLFTSHVQIDTSGYINSEGGQRILDVVNTALEDGRRHVILNLSGSKVVNSIGISYLIEVMEILMNSGGKLVFTNLDPSVDKALKIMGLFSFSLHAASVEEARKLLS